MQRKKAFIFSDKCFLCLPGENAFLSLQEESAFVSYGRQKVFLRTTKGFYSDDKRFSFERQQVFFKASDTMAII